MSERTPVETLRSALTALYLEVEPSIAADVARLAEAALVASIEQGLREERARIVAELERRQAAAACRFHGYDGCSGSADSRDAGAADALAMAAAIIRRGEHWKDEEET